MGGDRHTVLRAEPIDRSTETDHTDDVGRARFELLGSRCKGGRLEADPVDHVTAALPWRHRVQMLTPRPQYAGAGGTEDLVSTEAVEVDAERGKIETEMWRGLGPIEQYRDTRGLRECCKVRHRVDGPERIRHVRHGEQSRALGQQDPGGLEVELAGLEHRDRYRARPDQLPGDDVRVMFHRGDQNPVVGSEGRAEE